MMPRAVKVISTLNILFASIFISNGLFIQKMGDALPQEGFPLASFINLASAGAMIIITLIALLRLPRLVGFSRLLIYTITLLLGLNILLMAKYLITLYGIATIVFNLIVIFYIIGVRGYLASDSAANYFTHSR